MPFHLRPLVCLSIFGCYEHLGELFCLEHPSGCLRLVEYAGPGSWRETWLLQNIVGPRNLGYTISVAVYLVVVYLKDFLAFGLFYDLVARFLVFWICVTMCCA